MLAITSAGSALAADGVLEINHVCATTTGCFPGDAPGYPVEINQPGSYRLTSNLTVPSSTNGIEVGNGVDIDLGGFEIAGPISCLTDCPPPGVGSGIASTLFGGSQCAVSNGKVRGFAADGIRLGLQARVRAVTVTDIARHGISLSGGSFAAENLVNRVGQNGLRFGVSSVFAPSLYRDNTIADTGGQSVVDGKASGPNVCQDQLCGTSGKKFFYLTTTGHTGAEALSACATGFHMASLFEILEPSSLEYDTTRGVNQADSGQGPPSNTILGWVRTGGAAASSAITTGRLNCDAWTSSSGAGDGALAGLADGWDTPAGQQFPAWDVIPLSNQVSCADGFRVWCVQD